jgi:hypothetical protein
MPHRLYALPPGDLAGVIPALVTLFRQRESQPPNSTST